MSTVTHDEAGELLAAYALDAVTDEERTAIDAHLRSCRPCRDELSRHREAAGFIAQTELPSPSGQWDRIEAAISERASAPVISLSDRRHRTALTAVVAATVAAAAAALITLVVVDSEGGDETDLATVAEAAANEPGAQRLALETVDGATAMEAVVLPDGRAYVLDDEMGALPDGRTYQLWGLDGSEMISLAVLGADPEVLEFQVPAGTRQLAITEEDAPGAVEPTGDPLATAVLA